MTTDVPPASENNALEAEENKSSEDVSQATAAEGEDQTLTCVDCESEFVFTTDEQEFFRQKELHSPPKRCKPCRAERRKARRGRRGGRRMKDYRGPAFRDRRSSQRSYRSPAFRDQPDVDGIYRSPGFQGTEEDPNEIYRSPGFQGTEQDPNEIYRGPAFQQVSYQEEEVEQVESVEEEEHDLEQGPPPGFREPSTYQDIYRSPAFADTDPANYAPSYRRRQMQDIICADCGRKAQVPFKPRKDRPVYCKECFAKRR